MQGPQKYIARVQVDIRSEPGYSGSLTVAEEFHVKAEGFMELCGILAKFDELAKKLQKEQ